MNNLLLYFETTLKETESSKFHLLPAITNADG